MSRPTISCAVIAKNEIRNIDQWYQSIEGCFDEIVFCDTGSTDGTIERAKELGLKVVHFEWCDDFAKARNYAFSQATGDFIFWNDLDDVLSSKEQFITWRDNVMDTADFWMANYEYSADENGKTMCNFIRERAVRASKGSKWKYFLHEGLVPNGQCLVQIVKSWSVIHKRTEADLKDDNDRNLRILKAHEGSLDARMMFYYGKELFDRKQPVEACHWLSKAMTSSSIEPHDRCLSIQYLAYAYMACNQFEKAASIAINGIQLSPHRAELYCIVADCFIALKKHVDAIPFLHAATKCHNEPRTHFNGAIFSHAACYGEYPLCQLARVYAQIGRVGDAKAVALEAKDLYGSKEAMAILHELKQMESKTVTPTGAPPVSDVVITCPPGGLYHWDRDVERARGVGGSEIAAIEMAEWIKKLTGRRVIIFNQRSEDRLINGVEYVDVQKAAAYFQQCKPALHVAWRHTAKLTDAKTIVWSHDIATPGAEHAWYHKLLCLSDFHSKYNQSIFGLRPDKIDITGNGIDPKRFLEISSVAKQPGKVVYSSSPDRGLKEAILVCDLARKVNPDIELHVYYGFDNMRKMNMNEQADFLLGMIKERPWVKYHGNVKQDDLAKELASAEAWLYPTWFTETFCITALEMLACKVYPVARAYGAIPNTLSRELAKGKIKLTDRPCVTEEDHVHYASLLVEALDKKLYTNIDMNPEDYSWENVAKQWIERYLK